MIVASDLINKYFEELELKSLKEFEIASKARAKNYDPKPIVEISLARNIGERVEGLVSAVHPEIKGTGIAERIVELEKKYEPGDWRVGFTLCKECAEQKFVKIPEKIKILELSVRIGLAYMTQGTVSAPLEGMIGVKEKDRADGKKYVAIYYAGPIRAAGGTAEAISVVLADYARKLLGYASYDPTKDEIKRYYHELELYNDRVSRLQYFPSEEETELLINFLPIELNGTPTSKKEVILYKEVGRVETSKIRGGMCLVLGEGVAQKSKKLLGGLKKFANDFELGHWLKFLEEFITFQKKIYSGSKKENSDGVKVAPNFKYLRDAIGGRPILSFPSHPHGFRIRYGRTRVSGVEGYGFNPTTSYILNNFLAIGTQLAIERPGKGCTITTCEVMRGPVVKLDDGSVLRVDDYETYENVKKRIKEILFLGDVLINYGAFLEHKHLLVPSPFVEEWWALELKNNIKETLSNTIDYDEILKNKFEKISYETAKQISIQTGTPLHPYHTFFWKLITPQELKTLVNHISNKRVKNFENVQLVVDFEIEFKKILENLLIPHKMILNNITFDVETSKSILDSLGYEESFEKINNIFQEQRTIIISEEKALTTLEIINKVAPFEIRDVTGYTMGARMGRPEKAKMRKMKSSPHILFPVSEQGGRLRSLNAAYEEGYVKTSFSLYFCEKCNLTTVFGVCDKCGSKTKNWSVCKVCKNYTSDKEHCNTKTAQYDNRVVDVVFLIDKALENLRCKKNKETFGQKYCVLPPLMKGVKGTSNERHVAERLEKGILRALNKVYVNKDGTIRMDVTELPLTHFKPCEIGTSIQKLKFLGYEKDIEGKELENENQILELKPQDIVLPACKELADSDLSKVVMNITKFLDELLEKMYGLPKYYNAKNCDDLAGTLCIALAPHTSAGTLTRIIGFTKTQGGLAHPLLHAATRRDCDGDEVGFMLLLDAFINFSHEYLPNLRGTKNMDCPLVLALALDTSVVDDEVYNMDLVWEYSKKFYYETQKFPFPTEINVGIIENVLEKPEQYENYGFTHPVKNFNDGVTVSSYKLLPTMAEKVEKQMDIAVRIKAIDSSKVASLVIERHFLRDIKGNLRKFSQQKFRCVSCNEKYRRIPLLGKCLLCNGDILLTIHEGSVVKYVEQSLELARKYTVQPYLMQSLELLKMRIDSVFGKEKEKQQSLSTFF
ncbi:MAG: DNA polymerase II large subunit [Nanoarchaeota archaeon]|nr:DNA polymerase II large subunit [Nanoarchaeota archaeon]